MSKLKSRVAAMYKTALSLGSNLGDRQIQLATALEEIQNFAPLASVSSLYETDPVGNIAQPSFFNIAVLASTTLDVHTFHSKLRQTELDLGRVRSVRGGPRRIDIDIIFYEDDIIDKDDLTIPHPRYADRNFVLLPLCEIVPDWMCPLRQQTVSVIQHLCTDSSRVRRIASNWFDKVTA